MNLYRILSMLLFVSIAIGACSLHTTDNEGYAVIYHYQPKEDMELVFKSKLDSSRDEVFTPQAKVHTEFRHNKLFITYHDKIIYEDSVLCSNVPTEGVMPFDVRDSLHRLFLTYKGIDSTFTVEVPYQ